MRIISSFHDYYDSIQAYGQDPNLVYRRECVEVVIPQVTDARLIQLLNHWGTPDAEMDQYRLLIIGFCGRVYPAYIRKSQQLRADELTTHKGFELMPEQEYIDFLRVWGMSERVVNEVQQGLAWAKLGDSLFITCRAPIFYLVATSPTWRRSEVDVELYTNPRLSNINFASLVDPFTAYQEIAMFLGSQLAVEDKAPRTVGDDKIIAASKGFDEQSFITNFAGEKEQKRKANRARKRGRRG